MAERDEGNSFFKWLVALGLPLLLLALFVVHQQTKNTSIPQPQQTIDSRPVDDGVLGGAIRKALFDNSSLSSQAKDSVTIDVNEGIVTLKGTVSSNAEKSLIEKIAKNTSGTIQVNNEIEVR